MTYGKPDTQTPHFQLSLQLYYLFVTFHASATVYNAETKETLELFFLGGFHPWRMEGRYVRSRSSISFGMLNNKH